MTDLNPNVNQTKRHELIRFTAENRDVNEHLKCLETIIIKLSCNKTTNNAIPKSTVNSPQMLKWCAWLKYSKTRLLHSWLVTSSLAKLQKSKIKSKFKWNYDLRFGSSIIKYRHLAYVSSRDKTIQSTNCRSMYVQRVLELQLALHQKHTKIISSTANGKMLRFLACQEKQKQNLVALAKKPCWLLDASKCRAFFQKRKTRSNIMKGFSTASKKFNW